MENLFYNIKLWFGFRFLRWKKPNGYDYGYFMDKNTVILKKRIASSPGDRRKIKTILKVLPDNNNFDWDNP